MEGILEYVATRTGPHTAVRVHDRLMGRIESLAKFPLRGRIIPELREIGLMEFREVRVSPYRIHGNHVVLVGVLDGRRDLEELLIERALST
jgi:plasmid stabilization system protein ParE